MIVCCKSTSEQPMPMPKIGVFRNCAKPTSRIFLRSKLEPSAAPSPVNEAIMVFRRSLTPRKMLIREIRTRTAAKSARDRTMRKKLLKKLRFPRFFRNRRMMIPSGIIKIAFRL